MDRSMVWPPPQHHHRRGHSMGSGVREKDEDLALFKDMGKRDKTPFLYPSTDDQLIDASLSTKYGELSHPHSATPVERKGIGAELLNSDVDKTDYDWLMTPPGTPLFPSLDADSTALQQGTLINRSLAAIKTSRVSTAPRSNSPAPNLSRGNPSPSRRPSTPQNGHSSAAGTRSQHQLPAKQTSNNRPATPTRSSTPISRASPNLQARPSTPTRQKSATARPVTPLGARPATPTSRRPETPTSSGRPSSSPTLRRSSSSPTGCQPGAGAPAKRTPSPARSTASTGTSARGVSPARSGPSRGVSPVRGVSPAPSRGRSPSPSLRAPYPVEASDDIPPNLRTTSDRPSSAQRRAVAFGASPGEGRVSSVGVDPVSMQRRTPSPARSAAPSLSSSVLSRNIDRASRAASSDSESSFDTCSQSGVSNHGLVTPERSGSRGRMFGRGSDDYGRSSSLQKARRSSTSPQFGPSASKKSFESAAREYHRGQVAAFRPLMTNSSISTFYSSRASGLLRRPLTPSSTASSSEHGATVAHDSEVDDEDAGSTWKPSNRQASSGAHSPLHLFDKSLSDAAHETGTLDATSIVDNDELSSYFRTPEALEEESLGFKCLVQVASNRRDEESQEICNAELNWLSRNEHVEDREYLWSRDVKDVDINIADGAAGAIVQGSKQGLSGLDKIRDKLRHLKSTTENENAESESKVQQAKSDINFLSTRKAPAALDSVVDRDSLVINPTEMQGTCEVCSHRKQRQAGAGETSESWPGCHCSAVTTSLPFHEVHEGGSARILVEGSSSTTMESAESNSKLPHMVYGKERDIWYIYRHSSEYEVPVAGFSGTKMEIDSPQLLAKEVHMRASAPFNHDLSRGIESSQTSVSAQLESSVEREDISPTVYTGKNEYAGKCNSKGQKEHVITEKVVMEEPRDECLLSDLAEGGNAAAGAALKGKELDQQYSEGLAIEAERRGLEFGGDHINRRMSSCLSETRADVGAGSKSVPQTGTSPEGGGDQKLKPAFNEPEKANQEILDQQFDNKSTQVCSSRNIVCQPLQMTTEPPQNSQIPALNSSSVPHHRATVVTPIPQSSEADKKPEESGQPTSSRRRGHEEYGVTHIADIQASQVLSVNGSHTSSLIIAEEHRHSRTEPSRPAKVETSETGLPVLVRITHAPPTADLVSYIEAHWNADHALVKESWQEKGLHSQTQFGVRSEANVLSRADEHERTYREPGDEVAFIDIPVDSCGRVTAGPRVSDVVSKHSADTRILNAPLSPSSKPQGHCLEPHMIEKKLSGLQDGSLTYNDGEILKQLNYQKTQENINSEDPHVLEKKINKITGHFDTSKGDVWNSVKLPHTGHRADILDTREAQKEKSERAQNGSGTAAEITGDSGKPFQRSGNAMQGSFSKSSSSKSSFRTPTSGSSIDLSRSTDTTSSCPSNASWEDPHLYGSKFWDSRPASDVARVSDVSEPAPLLLTKMFTADSASEETDAAKCGAHEVIKVGDLISYNGELQQSNPEVDGSTHNTVDQRLRASPDEMASTAEHFDYIFECLGSKRDPSPRAAEFPIVSKLMPGATISLEVSGKNAIAKPYFNGDSQSTAKTNGTTKASEVTHKDKTLLKSQSIRENIKTNSRAADSELPVVASSSPDSNVAVEAPMKVEEIVESAESPSPGTRKHMSSFKFSHKKSANAELKRSNTTVSSSSGSSASKLETAVGNGLQSSDSGAPGSKTTVSTKLNGKPASTSPHLTKGRSMRVASPARPLAAANAAKAPAEPAGAHGEVVPEEPSIHSRFSNITVRSGSDTENFDWGRSSLEETSSRCGSSSGTNTASMAILRSSLSQHRCHEVDATANGDNHAEPSASGDDDDDDDEEEQRQQASNFSPLRRSAEIQSEASAFSYDGAEVAPSGASAQTVLKHSALDSSKPLDSALHLLERAGPALDLDQKLSPERSTASSVLNPVLRPRASTVNNFAPKQNLDKLSEKLEQLETFGARVMLRNPQQQFLHSPSHDHSKDRNSRLPALEQPHLASFNTSSSSSACRLDQSGHSAITRSRLDESTPSSKPNKCHCTIL